MLFLSICSTYCEYLLNFDKPSCLLELDALIMSRKKGMVLLIFPNRSTWFWKKVVGLSKYCRHNSRQMMWMCACVASADNHCVEGNHGFMWTYMFFLFLDTYLFLAFFLLLGCRKHEKQHSVSTLAQCLYLMLLDFFFLFFFLSSMVFRKCRQLDLLDLCDVTSRIQLCYRSRKQPVLLQFLTLFHSSCKQMLRRLRATKIWDTFYLVYCIFRI